MLSSWIVLGLLACGGVDRDGDEDPTWDGWDDQPEDTVEPAPDAVELRVVTWNIEGLGTPESDQYIATRSILQRLDADVVGINEVEGYELSDLEALAGELGYSVVLSSPSQPFGGGGNAILSRLGERSNLIPSSPFLSGDPNAKDVTRYPAVHTGAIAGIDKELTVVSQHWKAGFNTSDDFRRSVDGWRTAQAAELGSSSDFLVVMGDVNGEPEDFPGDPAVFTELPYDLPFSYSLGADLNSLMAQQGIPHDPFGVLEEMGLVRLPATQLSGNPGTRPVSGRVIDHIFVSPGIAALSPKTEIYDTTQDIGPSIADGDASPRSGDSARASDHLPVLMVFEIPGR